MNNFPSSQSWIELIQQYTSRVVNPCMGWLPCLQRQHQVHPETGGLVDSNFVSLSSERRIRVIHIEINSKQCINLDVTKSSNVTCVAQPVKYPTEAFNPQLEHFGNKPRSHSMISNSSEPSSEDYWFTRWSRPLKLTEACNCSFRKSWTKSLQDSKFSNHILPETQEELFQLENSAVNNVAPLKVHTSTVIENFVEVLIQEILRDTIKNLSRNKVSLKHPYTDSIKKVKSENLNCFQKNDSSTVKTYPCHSNESLVTEESVCSDEYNFKKHLSNENGSTMDGMMGCINPNFIGSITEPDMVESTFHGVTQILHPNSDLSGTIGKDYASMNETESIVIGGDCCSENNTMVLGSINPCITFTSKSSADSPVTNSVTVSNYCKEHFVVTGNCDICVLCKSNFNIPKSTPVTAETSYNTETKVFNANVNSKTSEISLRLDPIIESNVPETVDQNVDLRKKNSTCHHTSNSIRLKPVLFFLHGVGCSADLWSSLLQHFAREGYEVVAPDMLGHGYSNAPDHAAAYTFHQLLKDALDIFDKFVGDQKKCVVIGHAYGCSLAAAMARYRPLQVSQLVLVSGGGPTPLAPRTADCRPPSVSPCLQACMKPLLMCGFRRDILYAPCGKHIGSGDALSNGVPPYVLRHIARGQDWPEGDSAFHRRILVPTLLVHGMQDPYITLVQECEMERTIPRSFLELIPNAGHFSMLETPKKLSHMIHCFIEWWSR